MTVRGVLHIHGYSAYGMVTRKEASHWRLSYVLYFTSLIAFICLGPAWIPLWWLRICVPAKQIIILPSWSFTVRHQSEQLLYMFYVKLSFENWKTTANSFRTEASSKIKLQDIKRIELESMRKGRFWLLNANTKSINPSIRRKSFHSRFHGVL